MSIALRLAELSPLPLALVSRALFERLDRVAPGSLSAIAVELQHDDGGPVLPYVAVTPTVVALPTTSSGHCSRSTLRP